MLSSDLREIEETSVLLSICIVNWNTRDYLRECLDAIKLHPPRGSSVETIVVDNASSDGSAEMVESDFPNTVLIRNSDNKGYADGNNQAMRAAKGDYILLLNSDAIVQKDTLAHALLFMRSHPNASVLGARQLSKDGSTQSSLRSFPDPWPVFWEYIGFSKLFPNSKRFGAYRMTYFDYNHQSEVDQPMGTFLLMTRAAFDKVGLFDSQFPIFFNEVDWCYRAKRTHDLHIFYAPDVTVLHYGGGSTRQVKPRMIRESHQSLLKFYEKHYRNKIPPLMYSLIEKAVLWNERRSLKRAILETTQTSPPSS
jgi:GT2 family glycosyltransferase